jgi:predicted DNA-binding protein YlxM (UPF0122 family)
MARNKTLIEKRNADILTMYNDMAKQNKKLRMYRMEYILNQIATKFYVTRNTVYHVIRNAKPATTPTKNN